MSRTRSAGASDGILRIVFGAVGKARLGWREALSVFVAGMLLTAVLAAVATHLFDEAQSRRLDVASLDLAGELQSLVLVHTALLSSLRSLALVSAPLTRTEFHAFVSGGKLLEQHPGALALEFARRVPAADLSEYQSTVQAELEATGGGYPTFQVHPHDIAGERWVVEYVEPLPGNEAAFGLDLASETSRREAIATACAGVRTAATNPVRLVQETGASSGLVVFAPVYDVDPPPASPNERRDRCVGLMIVVYRAHDMVSTLGRANDGVEFRLVDLGANGRPDDGLAETPETLLFDSEPHRVKDRAGRHRRVPVDFHGRRWEVIVSHHQSSIAGLPMPSVAVGAVGVVFSATVAFMVLQLAAFRRRALARGRVVAAGDRDRRSLERDLHDGAQQRLLSVSLALGKAHARMDPTSEPAALVDAARDELARSLEELRQLAQGLHPAVLSDHGLGVAAKGVVARATVPIDLRLELDRRLPLPVEVAAYYVVCEALANAVKHAQASKIGVTISIAHACLCVDVQDNGIGSVDMAAGSGLRGLVDRVEAVDGRLEVTSRPGRGTWVRARIPFE